MMNEQGSAELNIYDKFKICVYLIEFIMEMISFTCIFLSILRLQFQKNVNLIYFNNVYYMNNSKFKVDAIF